MDSVYTFFHQNSSSPSSSDDEDDNDDRKIAGLVLVAFYEYTNSSMLKIMTKYVE